MIKGINGVSGGRYNDKFIHYIMRNDDLEKFKYYAQKKEKKKIKIRVKIKVMLIMGYNIYLLYFETYKGSILL